MYRIFSFGFNPVVVVKLLLLLTYGFLCSASAADMPGSASAVDVPRSLLTRNAPRSVTMVDVPPQPQNTSINVKFDKKGTPARLSIWDNVFGGSSNPGCADSNDCNNRDILNNLICYSQNDATNGACPTKLVWYSTVPANSLKLIFKHEGNTSVTLNLTSGKVRDVSMSASWNAATLQNGFSVYIPASELNKLNLSGRWQARLKMRVMAWSTCSTHLTTGCDGFHRADWNADIVLNVTDVGRQQIYFPASPNATPQVSLNLNNRPGAQNTTASGTTSLDMCLYDGSNSSSNRISLLFQDEGASASGRPAGQFSVYRQGADKNQAANRLDYQVSVINPTTGAVQNVSNGSEIIWTNTNRRNIQRQVVLPGVQGVALCVPAPITLTTPIFRLADKTAGRYTGSLRIIYTPTTQTSTPLL
ncbi:CfaE/CblD family pilus tip adhesin [Serratia sp. J2]|uniref:CfaE/CblD family pilus tip adhesin n=1 Tax=Serratia sp. J2 TaxID=3386551 RepID=UPI003916E254